MSNPPYAQKHIREFEYISGARPTLTWIKRAAGAGRSAELLARQRRPSTERCQLGDGDVASHWRHTAIGAGDDALLRNKFHDLADHAGDLLGRLDRVARYIDDADQHVLAVEQRQQPQRHAGVDALDRDLADAALRQRRKNDLVSL